MPTIDYFLSGGLANVDPSQSLGGFPSNQEYLPGVNTLFAQVTSAEAQSGSQLYRCVYANVTSTDNLTDCSVSLSQNSELSVIYCGFRLIDEIQTIEFNGTPSGGTFTLKYYALVNGLTISQETYAITYSDLVTTASDIENALNDLTYLSTVIVEGQSPSSFQVTFADEDGFRSQILLEVTNFLVVGSTGATVTRVVSGSPKNAIAPSIGFENQPPFEVIFTVDSTEIGVLRPGDVFPIWLRRDTPADTIASSTDVDSAEIITSFTGPLD